MAELHRLTCTVTVELDLTVPTGIGPEQVARTVAQRVSAPFPRAVAGLGVAHRKEPVVTLGAWHLSNDDGSFSGKIG